MQVEIGNYMQNFGPDRIIKNKWVLQGMQRLGVEVFNVGEWDIDEFGAQGVDLEKDARFISANLLSVKTKRPLLHPFLIKRIELPAKKASYRIGFLGLSARDSSYVTDGKGYHWEDPLVAAKLWVPELRNQCDFLIVLACMPSKDAVQLAIDIPEIDVIVNGYRHQWSDPPAQINKATVVYAEDEGRVLGELRLQWGNGEKPQVIPLNHLLTRVVKDDPEMAAFVAQAKEEITAQQRNLVLGNAVTAAAKPLPTNSPFVTSTACASCHAAAFEVWQHSKHAQAIQILKQVRREFDSSCVGCHTTGRGKTGGFEDLNQTPELANVQCEACHGPGKTHRSRPSESKMAKLDATTCIQCHTKSNSPDFDFATYWPKIKH